MLGHALAWLAMLLYHLLLDSLLGIATLVSSFGGNAQPAASPQPAKSPELAAKLEALMSSYRDLYYKVQNLERFREVIPEARRTLESLLDQGLCMAQYKPRPRSILDIGDFDKDKLRAFLQAEEAQVLVDYEDYVQRRKHGAGPEHLRTLQEARQSLRKGARWNYADGVWLSRTHQITTPFALRKVMRDIWQIYSEELGDGDVEKNHVVVYRQLLQSVGVELPDADSADFIDPRHGFNDEPGWRFAVAQLLLSIFPSDFLPEILGFTLHYESPPLEGYRMARELPELGISPYYYTLHITIDNSDSGHAAMALASVVEFMDVVRETGLLDPRRAWRRIQAGYLLGKSLDHDETVHHFHDELAACLLRKADLARQVHCASRASIAGHRLAAWPAGGKDADPCRETSNAGGGRAAFLAALADSKPWIHRGDSGKSRLMRELAWKGRMFGAFTNYEVRLLRTWIDSLPSKESCCGRPEGDDVLYWGRVGGYDTAAAAAAVLPFDPPRHNDAAVTHPVFPPADDWAPSARHEFAPRAPLALPAAPDARRRLDALLPLWFVHPCLLENMINLPCRTIRPMYSHCLSLLRADKGLSLHGSGIACMDEQLRPSHEPDLVALGLAMARRHGRPVPACLGDVIPRCEQEEDDAARADVMRFCRCLLSWSQRPMANGGFLLGLSRAFLDLELWVSASETLLGAKHRLALAQIVQQKLRAFELCLAELQSDEKRCREFIGGYEHGRGQIERLLV